MAEKGQYTYEYPRPMVVVDALIFALRDARFELLLIKRGHAPFQGMWAIPGGFVELEEELDHAAARELEEETGLSGIELHQFHTFGALGRDPRGRVITVAFLAVVESSVHSPKAGDDAADVIWLPVSDLPKLASDHNLIVTRALECMAVWTKAAEGHPAFLPEAVSRRQFEDALGLKHRS